MCLPIEFSVQTGVVLQGSLLDLVAIGHHTDCCVCDCYCCLCTCATCISVCLFLPVCVCVYDCREQRGGGREGVLGQQKQDRCRVIIFSFFSAEESKYVFEYVYVCV